MEKSITNYIKLQDTLIKGNPYPKAPKINIMVDVLQQSKTELLISYIRNHIFLLTLRKAHKESCKHCFKCHLVIMGWLILPSQRVIPLREVHAQKIYNELYALLTSALGVKPFYNCMVEKLFDLTFVSMEKVLFTAKKKLFFEIFPVLSVWKVSPSKKGNVRRLNICFVK